MSATPLPLTRRSALGWSAAAGGAVLLAGCTPSDTSARPGGGASTPSGGSRSGQPGSDASTVVLLADIPVGGTASATLAGAPILLARPDEGSVVAFSAICPHQGCAVEAASDEFDCPCHGSRFEAATGEVLQGPASRGLTQLTVTVSGDSATVSA